MSLNDSLLPLESVADVVYVTDQNCVLMCRLCGAGFNSAKQAQSHYAGQKHEMRVAELKVGPVSAVPVRPYHLDFTSDFLYINPCMSAYVLCLTMC